MLTPECHFTPQGACGGDAKEVVEVRYHIECQPDGTATITATGQLTWNEAVDAGPRMLTLAREAGCTKVLFDLRELDVRMGTMDLRDLATNQARADFAEFKRALVVSRSLPEFAFYEHACRNLGQNMRVFNDIDEARAWLLEDTPSR